MNALQGFRACSFAAIGGVSLAVLAAFGAHFRSSHTHALAGPDEPSSVRSLMLMIADYGVRPVNMMDGDPV